MENLIYKFNYSIGSSIISLLYEFNENLILKNKDANNLLIKNNELIKRLNDLDLKEITTGKRKLNDIYLDSNFKYKILGILTENESFVNKNNNYKLLIENNNKLIIEIYYLISQNDATKKINNTPPEPDSPDINLTEIKKQKSIKDYFNNNQQKTNSILISDDNDSNESEYDNDSNSEDDNDSNSEDDNDSNSEYDNDSNSEDYNDSNSEYDNSSNESEDELSNDDSFNEDNSDEQLELSNFNKEDSTLPIRYNPSLNDKENQPSNNQWKEYRLLPDEYKRILKQIKSRFNFEKIRQNDLDLIFNIVKYLKYNFIIEIKDYKARPNFIVKKCLYEEIRSTINLGKSNFFKGTTQERKLNEIVLFTFKSNSEFCVSTTRFYVRDPDCRMITSKRVYKNLKRKNTDNSFSNINDEDDSIFSENEKWKKYKLSSDEIKRIERKIESRKRFNNILESDKKLIFDIIKYLRYNFIVEENRKNYIIKENLRNEIKLAIDINKSYLFDTFERYRNNNLGVIINFAFNDNSVFVSSIGKFNINGKICPKDIYRNLKRKIPNDNLSDMNDDISNTSSMLNNENNQLDQKWKEYELPLDQFNEIEKAISHHFEFRSIVKDERETIFEIVKYLKYNFIVEIKKSKNSSFFRRDESFHFVIKENLYDEIRSAINLNKSVLYFDSKLGTIINFVFKDDPNFDTKKLMRVRNKDGISDRIMIFKNLKRINHN